MYFYEYYISREKMKLDLNYKNEILENINLLEKLSKMLNIKYILIELEILSDKKKEELLESIRILSRKNKIGVSTKDGSGPLPISRGKKLNINCFLLCFLNLNLENVYPHIYNRKRLEITTILKNYYSQKKIPDDNGLEEHDILKIIETFPELISKDLIFLDREVEVENGRIDCVFKKTTKNLHILVEIEIYAKSISIEQILKFKRAYSKKFNVQLENIKLVIICGSIKDSTFRAATTCGICVYKLNLKKMN